LKASLTASCCTQVLQWQHLLNNVQAAALQDIRAQMPADGLFHVRVYAQRDHRCFP
jgi:uncharacterized membrane protein